MIMSFAIYCQSDEIKVDKLAGTYIIKRLEMQTKFQYKNLNGSDNLKDQSVDGRIILNKYCENLWIGIGSYGGLLLT